MTSKPETVSQEAFTTYRSENAPEAQRWLAYIHTGAGRLNMAFFGANEAAAIDQAKTFWDKDRAQREANIASREAARVKAAETRARKAEVNTAHKNSEG